MKNRSIHYICALILLSAAGPRPVHGAQQRRDGLAESDRYRARLHTLEQPRAAAGGAGVSEPGSGGQDTSSSVTAGIVRFAGLPAPGVTVTAAGNGTTRSAITAPNGVYTFENLPAGTWKFTVQMSGFSPIEREATVNAGAPPLEWELKMLPLDAMNAQAQTPAPAPAVPTPAPVPSKKSAPAPTTTQTPFQRTDLNASGSPQQSAAPQSGAFANSDPAELSQRAADGYLINGTANNGASSPFGQSGAFGNFRKGPGALYNANLGIILGNSATDARPYSLTGQSMPKPDYNRVQAMLSFGGPLKIPHLLKRNGPNLTLNYQWVRNRNSTTQTGFMPSASERGGDLSRWPNPIYDPASGTPFPGNVIPANRISAQAVSLLSLYPLPNFPGDARYNFQVPIAGDTHQDNLQTRFNQRLPRRNQLNGNFALSSTRTDNPNLFGFLDKTSTAGINTGVNWVHAFSQRLYSVLGVQYSRYNARVTPFFAERRNVSNEAGIAGNDQDPVNWGPPALAFSSGIAAMSDAQASLTRNQTTGVSLDFGWSRGRHNFAFGGLWRKQQFNLLTQEDPRGTFAFTGAATQARTNGTPVAGTGFDFAGFLLGIPDTISIAHGNADKYFRAPAAAAFITDDLRLNPGLTINYGVRWEYGAPITELYGRLVNLDIKPGFTAAAPVVATSPSGPLTSQSYPASLIRPDRNNFAPRVGFAWRPLPASSMIIRGGYGIYFDTSIYQSIASQMAQQSPLSTSLQTQNSLARPLTMANAFTAATALARNTYAIDPNFRTGYSQNWNLSVQRDLPGSLVVIGTYLGSKGTRSQQQFLPNTFPLGATDPCPACPTGFTYLTSNGNSIRHAGAIDIRRRLRSGFTASMQYTFAKSIDNAAPGGRNQGGALIAQNWLDLRAERALSNFDQRHLASATVQYTTGMGIHGGTLAAGKRAALFKEWTFSTQITAGSGLPLTPIYFTAVQGTGITGSIRPNYTGAPVYDAPPGFALNQAAYSAPPPGSWGNAGRNSIAGPGQFTLNGSISRIFQLSDKLSLDFRIDAANALNHPVFPSWNTVVNSAQFGLPNPANPMRSLQTVARLRF